MEKLFAKVVGNYDVMGGGHNGETWDFLAGTPYHYFWIDDESTINEDPDVCF